MVVLQFGSANLNADQVLLRAYPVQILGMTVPRDRLYLAGGGLGLYGAALARVQVHAFRPLRHPRRGGEREGRIVDRLFTWAPILAAANWVIATVLAGLVGILVGPITSINPISYSLLIVPALGAALAVDRLLHCSSPRC